MSSCIDVESKFAGYKLGYDDPSFTGTQDPWLKTIVCRSGFIAPHGGTKLIACTDKGRSKATRELLESELCEVVQHGDDGVNAVFDVKDHEVVFKIMRAKVR
tara:strand:+ start:686 stop:991 length:306 start_codon:yes stop_codon:yes gene_type:complete